MMQTRRQIAIAKNIFKKRRQKNGLTSNRRAGSVKGKPSYPSSANQFFAVCMTTFHASIHAEINMPNK
jgi:hypothetical protein